MNRFVSPNWRGQWIWLFCPTDTRKYRPIREILCLWASRRWICQKGTFLPSSFLPSLPLQLLLPIHLSTISYQYLSISISRFFKSQLRFASSNSWIQLTPISRRRDSTLRSPNNTVTPLSTMGETITLVSNTMEDVHDEKFSDVADTSSTIVM